jgi:hypothetical protein
MTTGSGARRGVKNWQGGEGKLGTCARWSRSEARDPFYKAGAVTNVRSEYWNHQLVMVGFLWPSKLLFREGR